MKVVGYCTIKKGALTGKGSELDSFKGQICRVMEFAVDGAVLVVNWSSTAMASFDKEDVLNKFECRELGEFIFHPDLSTVEQMAYMAKIRGRKGGNHPLLKQMVIKASLVKGEFYDDILFQKEREENMEQK